MTLHSPVKKNRSEKNHYITVSKFGGSSMADAAAIQRSAGIVVRQNSSVVVVSATYGTTNRLVELVQTAESGNRIRMKQLIDEVRTSHYSIADDLKISEESRKELGQLLDTTESLAYELEETARKASSQSASDSGSIASSQDGDYTSKSSRTDTKNSPTSVHSKSVDPESSPIDPEDKNEPSKADSVSPKPGDRFSIVILQLRDRLYGMGERMSSLLITDHLNRSGHAAVCLDAGLVIRTDDRYARAVPQFDAIESLCEQYIRPEIDPKNGSESGQKSPAGSMKTGQSGEKKGRIVVTQGFIGRTAEGHYTTLGRGGSDYSAAILAWGLNADILQIWTDVKGMATTDPRIVPEAKMIPEISFQEAAELATFGAKILHPSTLIPAIWKEIPVFVGSSLQPDDGGTWIYRDVGDAPLVRALAIRRKQALVTLTTPQMLHTYGFLYRIFKVFNDHRVSVDSITTSEISVAMTVDDHTLENKALIRDLEALGRLYIEESYELISLIGNNINHTAGLAHKVFTATADINVRMICQGASRHNFCFLVSKDHGEEAIRKLHKAFIG